MRISCWYLLGLLPVASAKRRLRVRLLQPNGQCLDQFRRQSLRRQPGGIDALLRQPVTRHQGRQLARPFLNRCLVEATAFVGDQTGADLDHDAARILQYTR